MDSASSIGASDDTLSRDHPISEFLRQQNLSGIHMSQEEFEAKYESHLKKTRDQTAEGKTEHKLSESQDSDSVSSIVLKFTTISENCADMPSFVIGSAGARIGQDLGNEVSVPSDVRLAREAHSTIEFIGGSFFISDGGFDHSASIRIGMGDSRATFDWIMEVDAKFSAGNSVFKSCGEDKDGNLIVEIIDGPLKGTTKVVDRKGATIGRSSDNGISVPDRELSRRHSKIEFNPKIGRFVVKDNNSTNGTYMQLVGPYGGRHKLHCNDHILVGRTGFSINRFDYGLSEEMGHRQTMEDACTIIQHLGVTRLNGTLLAPQSFFGVFDGHGGEQASAYLSQHLSSNVVAMLQDAAADILSAYVGEDGAKAGSIPSNEELSVITAMDSIVMKLLKDCFLQTDASYLSSAQNPQHGSTATTALILGQRLYCSNVGDSRTLLCRNFEPYPLSYDHKPSREDEAQRIRDAGGFVINNRVMGELAVSRAFGDVEFKKGIQSMIEEAGEPLQDGEEGNWDQPLIIAEPDFEVTSLTEHDQFLLLACDGLFDVFTPEDLTSFVRRDMEQHRDTQKCCQNLTIEAIRNRNSRDNVSVILVILNKWY